MKPEDKILGIIGGMGSIASSDFLKELMEESPAQNDQEYIEVLLHNNSKIPDRTEAILHNGESPVIELKRSANILENAGADYILFECITAHHFAEEVIEELKTANFLNMVDIAVDRIVEEFPDLNNIGILATTGAVSSGLWQKSLKKHNLNSVLMDKKIHEEEFMKSIYDEKGIKNNYITDRNKDKMLKCVNNLKQKGAKAVIAGCTEVPLILKQKDIDIPLIDPPASMIEKIIELFYF
ncbi:MAG: amino acid racemase [Candidatus Mcinerneyibacterium aminivorans]|uniref:Amino acid racemase n=1 Tax=Candidatus Mcinerneyibacterium aminivorans TaxID=2703815 RepID=A0A5D0M964_9BACT|nr:MAG: amino acid racemase [Candidatus Mcinerneyibacterium aminivorans]